MNLETEIPEVLFTEMKDLLDSGSDFDRRSFINSALTDFIFIWSCVTISFSEYLVSPLYLINKHFILLRKKNKLPAETHSVDFELEYGKATIEVHKDSIKENDSVLIIDDLIATGGTAEAAAKLVEISKGSVSGFIFVINLFDLGGCNNLVEKGYKIENLISFPGH